MINDLIFLVNYEFEKKRYFTPEVEFVSAGGSVKFLPVV